MINSSSPDLGISEAQHAIICNEWMRRYTEEPDTFNREWQTVSEFLQEQADGKEPSYGEACTAYLKQLRDELFPHS